MIPAKYLLPIIIVLVVIAYQYIGEGALAGLLALVFGMKGKDKPKEIEDEIDEHEELMGAKLDEVVEHNIEADKHHDAAQAHADDIIQEKNPVRPGHTRRKFSTK